MGRERVGGKEEEEEPCAKSPEELKSVGYYF